MTAKQELRQSLSTLLINGQTAAKWAPREKSAKKSIAQDIMRYFKLDAKSYRKQLSDLSETVEDLMCANQWDSINFSQVPSVASARLKKAFNRHTTKFAEYVAALVAKDPSVKVNAEAVYPYDVLKGVGNYFYDIPYSRTEMDHIIAQWDALPNYVGSANILPMVDVSGSMLCTAGKSSVTCIDVAISLGLYLSEKNQGKFKDTFLTFSTKTSLITLKGTIIERMHQMIRSEWAMSTNVEGAFRTILEVAVENHVPPEEMPEILLILSDLQFNAGVRNYNEGVMEMIRRMYEEAGYKVPNVVYWNLNAYDNVPVKAHESGAALVSGFSPSIMKAILAADMSEFTPYSIMMQTIMNERYAF